MSRRTTNAAAISLKLDSSPKQTTTTKPAKRHSSGLASPLNRANILSFLLGFIASSFVYMILWTPLPLKLPEPSSSARSEPRSPGGHKAAIVVPFRDRFDELEQFVPHMSAYLARKSIAHEIWVVNQVDAWRFNRAALINVGFLASARHADYMIMHDVDLLPLNDALDYSYPGSNSGHGDGPVHISAAGLHPEYNYSSFIGGVLSIRREHFVAANGMSNRYWGWGKEDDEFGIRLKEANLVVQRPTPGWIATGARYTFRDLHAETRRLRDKKRVGKQRREALRRDSTGLADVQYRVEAVRELTFVGNFSCHVLDVRLFCDRLDTHWCSMDYQFYD